MAEYIEREALLQDIEDSVRFTVKTGTISAEMRGVNKIIDRIKCAPAADVVPVVHGRWIEYQIPHVICCSNCDWATDAAEKNFQYCPNCGARMEEISE